jgi:hypothetical protein
VSILYQGQKAIGNGPEKSSELGYLDIVWSSCGAEYGTEGWIIQLRIFPLTFCWDEVCVN